ncbi:MAG: PilW family protein [Gemmatimonadota bacterium]
MDRTGDRGFTLVEVLIAIVAAGVLGASLLGLVLGQQRFYGESGDAILAQQNLRASLDLMGSELRMASPTDIMAANSDSIAVRFDVVRGVVCRVPGAGQAYVLVYDSVGTANLPAGFRGTAYSNPYDSTYVYEDGFTPSVTGSGTGTAPYNACVAKDAPDTYPGTAYRDTNGWGAFAVMPDSGALVRWYGRLSYWLGTSTSSPNGWAIWRNDQELVTPFHNTSRFRYVMANGSVQNSVVGVGQLDDIRMIRVEVTATGGGTNPYDVRRPIVYDIPLRNCTASC